MLFGQSLGEYAGGSGLAAGLASAVETGFEWLELSLREDRSLWIAGVVCLVLALLVFRRRV